MRHLRLWLGVAICALAISTLGATAALADPEDNPHAQTITLTCPFGQVTGTAVQGSSLIIEGGGLAILQGLIAADNGEVFIPINPGLERTGRLVQCTYFSERLQQQVIAHLLFVP
jgi:predicted secreted protein